MPWCSPHSILCDSRLDKYVCGGGGRGRAEAGGGEEEEVSLREHGQDRKWRRETRGHGERQRKNATVTKGRALITGAFPHLLPTVCPQLLPPPPPTSTGLDLHKLPALTERPAPASSHFWFLSTQSDCSRHMLISLAGTPRLSKRMQLAGSYITVGLPRWLNGKESAFHTGDGGSIPGSGRSPGR